MNNLVTKLTPEHHLILLDHIVEGLTIGQLADKHLVSKSSIYKLKLSDAWELESKSILSSIRKDSLSGMSRLAKKSIECIEGILDNKDAKDADVLRASMGVLDKVISNGGEQKSKVVLNMFGPDWHDKGENKGESGGNKVQIIIGDREYK